MKLFDQKYNPNEPIHIFPVQEVYSTINPLVFNDLETDLANYYVSNYGNIFSCYSGRKLSPATNDGYKIVALHDKSGKQHTMRIHRIVMMSFCYFPGCEKLFVNHINGDKGDNRIWNLE